MFLAAAASAVSGIVGAIGAISSGNAQAEAANRQAKIEERNRKISLQQTEVEQSDKRRENRRALSSIRAAYGANGFELAGSPLDVLEDSAAEQELDVSRIGYQGQLRAIGFTENAATARAEAKAAKTAGYIGAASSILSSASSVGRTLYQG